MSLSDSIALCLKNNNADMTVSEVFRMLAKGDAQLWGDDKNGAITAPSTVSGRKVLMLWFCWGDLKTVMQKHDRIMDFARKTGCSSVASFTPRKAWGRILPGYEQTRYWFERTI